MNVSELDDLKTAWQALDRKLDRHNQLLLEQTLHKLHSRFKRSLLPLQLGQALQMLLGVVLILPAVSVWSSLRDGSVLFWAGIVVHAYAVLMIIAGGVMQGLLAKSDSSDSVLKNQKRLATARHYYVIFGMCLGLPWWFLWIPFMMVIVGAGAGIDFYAQMPTTINWMLGVSIVCMLATIALHRWGMKHSRWSARIERNLAGNSLNRSSAILDEIKSFEQVDRL
jgi:serine/threonine-protein kinase